MAIAPTILIEQATLGAGSAGVSRADGVVSQEVTLTDPANPGVQAGRLWEVFDTDGAVVTLSDNTAEAPTFTPGASDYGTHTVFVSYGDGMKSWIEGANLERIQLNQGGFGIAQPISGNIMPGAGETTQFGAAGFAAKLNSILRPLDSGLVSTYERAASFGVGIGVSTQEATLGRVAYSGSLIGVSVHAEESTTAGLLTINVRVAGIVKLTTTLAAGGTAEFNSELVAVGTHPIGSPQEITVEVIGDASYDNTPSAVVGIVVGVTLVDGSGNTNPNVALLDSSQVFTAGQSVGQATLSDGAGIVVNAAVTNNFELMLGQHSTLANPVGVVAGTTINIAFRQDPTGGYTLGYDTAYKFTGGAPVIPAGANNEGLISCYVRAATAGVATSMICSMDPGPVVV